MSTRTQGAEPQVVNERIAERRAEVRALRRRRRLRRTVTVTVLSVLLVAGVLVERSPLVALATVTVVGNERLGADEVRDLAGLETGTSVLRLPLGRAEAALEEHPLVADAVLRRDGPLGITVEVVEEQPVLVATDGSERVLLGADGTVLDRGVTPGVLRVQVPGPLPAPGERVDDAPALATAHTVLTGITGPLAPLVQQARATRGDDLELTLRGGTIVRWGDAGRAGEKARSLGAVLEDLGDRQVRVIDVRAPAAPVVRD